MFWKKETQIDRIKNKLEEAMRKDADFSVFGASSHKYRVNEELTTKELTDWQAKHQVTLPEPYIFAAVCHAIWNALSKKIEERDAFFTLILGASVILYFPLAVYLWQTSSFPPGAIKWLLLSICSEVLYFVALGKAYKTNHLSYAYPILIFGGAGK